MRGEWDARPGRVWCPERGFGVFWLQSWLCTSWSQLAPLALLVLGALVRFPAGSFSDARPRAPARWQCQVRGMGEPPRKETNLRRSEANRAASGCSLHSRGASTRPSAAELPAARRRKSRSFLSMSRGHPGQETISAGAVGITKSAPALCGPTEVHAVGAVA